MFLYFKKGLSAFYSLSYFILFGAFYRKLSYSAYVSPFSIIRNKKNLSIGPNCIIRQGASVGGKEISFAENVRVGIGSHIMGRVIIKENVMIAPNVVIAGGKHGMEKNGVPMVFQKNSDIKYITIGSDVWIGANSVILDGLNIGTGVVVGAGSVVTADVEDYAIVAGNPARKIRSR